MSGWMRTIRSWLNKPKFGGGSLRSNAPLMLLSVGLATLLWSYVTIEQNPSLTRNFTGIDLHTEQTVNAPSGSVATGLSLKTINVRISGPTGQVNDVQQGDVQVRLDLSRDAQGVGCPLTGACEVPIKVSVAGHNRVAADPDQPTVNVTLERVVKKVVPVKINTTDNLPFGFDRSAPPVATPAEATISGIQQNVNAVDAVYADLKLSGLTADTVVSLQLNPRDSSGRQISDITVQPQAAQVKAAITRSIFPRDVFVSVPVKGTPAPGYAVVAHSVDPATVTVSGTLDAINGLTTVSTDDVDVDGATQDVKRVVSLKLPPGIAVVTQQPPSQAQQQGRTSVTATVTIQAVKEAGSAVVAPRVLNVGQGLYIQALTTSLTISFTGPEPQILALKPGDITVTVDAGGLGPGNYNREPKVTLPQGWELDTSQPLRVDFVVQQLLQPQSNPPAASPAAGR